MRNILFIPRWYPDRNDPMPGLFIQQLASAMSKYFRITVIYPVHDDTPGRRSETVVSDESGVRVIRVYYRRFQLPLLKFANPVLFWMAFLRCLSVLDGFVPDLIHAHVLTRHAVLAWYCSRRFRVRFIISEHWSRYFPKTLKQPGWLNLLIARQVVRKSSALLPVSQKLAEALNKCGICHPRTVITGNFVDETAFKPSGRKKDLPVINILHVSCFDDHSKNISGLLDIIRKASEVRSDFLLTLVGVGPDYNSLQDYAKFTGINEKFVKFAGQLTGEDMIKAYQGADFLVQSSRFETFGSVVIEALACGIPVLATATGIATDIITAENGILVGPDDERSLITGMNRMLDSCRSYDPQVLRESVIGRFSSDVVGKKVNDLYNLIMSVE